MTEMTRLSQVLIPIPEWMFAERPHIASKNPASVRWTCEKCGVIEPKQCANGWTRRQCPCEVASREAQSYGMLMQTRKALTHQQKADKTYRWLGKDATEIGLEEKFFTNFDPSAQPEKAKYRGYLATVKMFASQVINSNQGQKVQIDNLLMKGSYGTGKTHLAAAILNELRARGIGCLFCTAQNLFNTLYAADFDGKQELIGQLGATPLAVIDELDGLHLGQNTAGEFQRKTLFDILNRRYQRRLPTILITNAEDLSPWLEGKAMSRLFEHMTVLEMNGVDCRSVKPKGN